ncbi:unnamed protein product [Prorocentrum cordatum]|uniref:Uncharacterized protein n=1 Tax=Prorocentrum cordatum TaxID=2364126 RepID=A0ABN9TZY4_9DINO|nr:unnamed protein product [Polarella glacialis]
MSTITGPCGSSGGDRSLTAESEVELDRGLELTKQFDAEVGFVENESKRQHWSVLQESNSVEHLGVMCDPARARIPITPGGGWSELEAGIQILKTFPGRADARERIALAYLRPLWMWATPFLEPVPQPLVGALFQAIQKTRCSWWCSSRWWARRAYLHPRFSPALQTLKVIRSPLLVSSVHLRHALRAHFECLEVEYVDHNSDWGVKLRVHPDDDQRV